MLVLLLACADPVAPEHGAPMDGLPDGALTAGGWTAEVIRGRLTVRGGGVERVLGEAALPELAFAGDQLAWPATDGAEVDLWAVRLPDGVPERLTDWPGYEDRPVYSPDGARLGFFSGRSGVVSLYVLDRASGAVTQVTNVGVETRRREPGRPPEGFVPPPDAGTLRWDAEGLSWTASGQPVRVRP